MDFELWWLLPIPALFFALGWIAARIDIKHLLRESRALPLSYFRGLNFLLNEQPDKAIESFIEVVKVDPQTIDLHFALGNLFPPAGRDRPRDPDAPEPARPRRPSGRTSARSRSSSWPRISIAPACSIAPRTLFTKLDGSPFELQSHGFLLQIYEQEKDWQKAIAVTQRMEALAKRPYFKEIAHYYLRAGAELAAALAVRRSARPSSTRRWPSTSCARGRRCCWATSRRNRATIQAAIAAWQRIESQNPAVPRAGRRSPRRRLPQDRRRRAGHSRTAQLRGPVSVARSADDAVQPDPGARRRGSRDAADQGRAHCAIRRCSASTSCSKRS